MTTAFMADTDRARLQGAALADALACCPAWHYDTQRDGTISRVFEFSGFRVAFAFMTQLAFIADKLAHHPEWSNIYASVSVTLTTHDAGGLSQADIDFAMAADKVFALFAPAHR
jgi:4a-hydroxytetrahydrobiopterin dehydratase